MQKVWYFYNKLFAYSLHTACKLFDNLRSKQKQLEVPKQFENYMYIHIVWYLFWECRHILYLPKDWWHTVLSDPHTIISNIWTHVDERREERAPLQYMARHSDREKEHKENSMTNTPQHDEQREQQARSASTTMRTDQTSSSLSLLRAEGALVRERADDRDALGSLDAPQRWKDTNPTTTITDG